MTTLVELDGAASWFGTGHTQVTALHPTSLIAAIGVAAAKRAPAWYHITGRTRPGLHSAGLARHTEPDSASR